MKKIELTRNCFALVDDEDYETYNKYSWHCTDHGYVARRDKDNKHHYLHRDVMNASKGQVTDHIDGNRLNNQKTNLRICTSAQNAWNTKRKKGRVPMTGVYISDTGAQQGWHLKKKFATRIKINGKAIWLGRHETAEKAFEVYKDACIKLRGEFAKFD